jgi:hypothetical protein
MRRKDHWDAVDATGSNNEVNWHEGDPKRSLDLFERVSRPPTSVIDVG